MTAYQLGTIIMGALALIMLFLVGVVTGQPSVMRMALALIGLTYIHYFIGTAIESGDLSVDFYGKVHAVLTLVVIVGWITAFVVAIW